MGKSTAESYSAEGGRGAFHTTHWTVVLQAASPESPGATEAFGQLYVDYWYPLHAYVRRRGFSPAEAEDIAQDFFARLIEKHALAGLAQEGGRFRSFLIQSLNNFLANDWDRSRAQKRGGGQRPLSLNAGESEARFALEKSDGETPDSLFERRWVLTLLERVMEELRRECHTQTRAGFFDDVRLHLQGDRQGPAYVDIAARHGMSEGAVKVAVHRLRQRYGRLLREEIGRTVSTPGEVDEELSGGRSAWWGDERRGADMQSAPFCLQPRPACFEEEVVMPANICPECGKARLRGASEDVSELPASTGVESVRSAGQPRAGRVRP